MEREPINLLKSLNAADSLTGKTTKTKRPVFFLVFISISIIIGIFIVRSMVRTEGTEYTTTLAPRKLSFLETVKNFILHPDSTLIGQDEDRINILLLGIGGPGHDGPYLSDTNIILSLKPSTHEVALISVPRDLGALVGSHGWRKINSADAFGEAEQPGAGGEYARQVFENTFHLKIPYFLRIDFKAFQELIDDIGGINVNVPTAFTDTAYPGPNFSYTTIHFDAGPQIMDGEHALIYARSRHGNDGEGSDFARSRRQQLIMEAVKEKMLSFGILANPSKLKDIYDSLTAHLNTNLNIAELTYLASAARDTALSKKLVLDSSPNGYLINTTGESGAFILSPKTRNFDTINLAIQNIFNSDNPSQTSTFANSGSKISLANYNQTGPKIEIENGTWTPGLAARTEKKLEDNGYHVIMVSNSLIRPIKHTVIYLLSDKVTISSTAGLSKLLEAASSRTLPYWLLQNYDNTSTPEDETGMKYNKDADILIILGTDTKE